MKQLISLLPFAFILFSSGCTACKNGELRFEAPPFVLGTAYTTPIQIYNNGNGLTANIGHLTYGSGVKAFGAGKIENTPPHPFGSLQMIRMTNTVLNFDLKAGTTRARFEYLDQDATGGTINLGVHGSAHLYIGAMDSMPTSMVINGVSITKSNVKEFFSSPGQKSAERGVITLTFSPDIGDLIIGGQEMYLDNFCFD